MWLGIRAKNEAEAKRKLIEELKDVNAGSVKISRGSRGHFIAYYTRKRKKRVVRNPFLGNWW